MIEHLVTRFEAARLDVHQRNLRRREETAIAKLGETTLADGKDLKGRLATLASEAAAVRGRLRSTAQSGGARDRVEALEQKLRQIHLTAGRLVLSMPPTGAESEVLAIRAEIADAADERDRLRGEGRRMVDDTWTGARAWVAPRVPALATAFLAWLIARGYTVSHTAAILSSVGYSHTKRGSHLVNLTVDTFLVRNVLPLVAALLCGYAAHRIAGRVQATLETVRARSAAARLAAGSDAAEPRTQGSAQRSAHRAAR
jgi:hypothetical protein